MKPKQLDVCFLVDRHSFPKKCGELSDFQQVVEGVWLEHNTESPTEFFRKALEIAKEYELVVPVTRNLFIRDRLRQEGVNLCVCL